MNSLHNEGMDGEFAALSKIMNFSINGGVPRALDVVASWYHPKDKGEQGPYPQKEWAVTSDLPSKSSASQ